MHIHNLDLRKITDILKERRFTLSVEIVPLRNGESHNQIFQYLQEFSKLGIDFASVTRGAGGSLRGGTLPLAYFIREKFRLNSIAHFTCMENTKERIENELIDHHLLGVRNILALRGDAPIGKELKVEGEYKFAWQLARQINAMNEGTYIKRDNKDQGLGEKTAFCIGVAAYPDGKDLEKEVEYLGKKVEEGAEYAITQMVFEAEKYCAFVDRCKEHGINIPIIPGIRPLISKKQYEFTEKFFKLNVPQELKNALNVNSELAKRNGIAYSIKLCKELKAEKAPGVHFFVINNIKTSKEIINSLIAKSLQVKAIKC